MQSGNLKITTNLFDERMTSSLLQMKHGVPNRVPPSFITKNVRFKIRTRISGALLFLLLLFSYFRGDILFKLVEEPVKDVHYIISLELGSLCQTVWPFPCLIPHLLYQSPGIDAVLVSTFI